MRNGTEADARTVASSIQARPLRVSFVGSAGAALLRDPVPEYEAEGVGDLRGEDRREGRTLPEWPSVVCPEESERRIVPVARCCGSSGDIGEPFPGWNLIGEGVWAKGAYVIAGGPPFLLAKKVSIIHDEIVFETLAEYPTLEAAVMRAELADDLHSDDDVFNLAMLHSAARFLNGR